MSEIQREVSALLRDDEEKRTYQLAIEAGTSIVRPTEFVSALAEHAEALDAVLGTVYAQDPQGFADSLAGKIAANQIRADQISASTITADRIAMPAFASGGPMHKRPSFQIFKRPGENVFSVVGTDENGQGGVVFQSPSYRDAADFVRSFTNPVRIHQPEKTEHFLDYQSPQEIARIQHKIGVAADGIVGPATRAAYDAYKRGDGPIVGYVPVPPQKITPEALLAKQRELGYHVIKARIGWWTVMEGFETPTRFWRRKREHAHWKGSDAWFAEWNRLERVHGDPAKQLGIERPGHDVVTIQDDSDLQPTNDTAKHLRSWDDAFATLTRRNRS